MENIRIIPRLDIKGPNVVKGVFTEGLRVVGSPKELVRKYYDDGADEILYMDIVASLYRRNPDFDLLRSVVDGIFIPITVGGGIRSVKDIDNALRLGADKVAINTFAIKTPKLIPEAVKKFGSQCIVLSIEAKKRPEGWWEAYTDGGREHSGVDAVAWAKKAINLGIGEIIITSIDRDGTRNGFESDLIKKITDFSPVPIVAHGGAGTRESFKEILEKARPDAVAAATVFHYKDYKISGLKKYLEKEGYNVRI